MGNWNLFSISGLLLFVTCFIVASVAFWYSRNRVQFSWVLFNVAVGVWGICAWFIGKATSQDVALFWWKYCHLGIIFLAVFLFQFVYYLCNLKSIIFLYFTHTLGAIFVLLIVMGVPGFVTGVRYVEFFGFYYANLGIYYNLVFGFWVTLVIYSHLELFKLYKKTDSEIKKNQLSYLFFGTLTGFVGGITNFLPAYKIDIYPFGNLGIFVYTLIVTYAIFRLRLLDISLVITRTTIFVLVYSIILGIPFIIAFGLRDGLQLLLGQGWWMAPLFSMAVFATVGPFIYLYIDKKAEEKIFQEQNRYQSTLRQASIGMGRIKDLTRLVNLIVHIVTRTVRIEHSMIYLYDAGTNKFQLKGMRARQLRFSPAQFIVANSSLVTALLDEKNPIVYEEIKQRTQDYGDLKLARLEGEMAQLDAALVVPSFVDEKLIAIMVLGKKTSNKLYTQEDLAVFSILANQAALAIENAMFYEDMKQTHEQLFKAEKMATIGTMADGLSHQINNRLHALGFIAGDALDTIKLKKILPMSDELKEVLIDLEHALNRIQENVVQGGEVVRGLLKYTRKGEEGFAEVDLNHLVDEALEMAQFKIKKGDLVLQRDYTTSLPKIKGNFTQLQEVFFNLIDNAYDAMMQRKHELNEPGFKPILRISAQAGHNGYLDVNVQDNGIGIKDEDKSKVFTPFFTTKLSSKKGTGLGLYVIRKLIEENHEGKVVYKSVYKEGTLVELSLPIYMSAVGT